MLPSIIFESKDTTFAIHSKNVVSIMHLPKIVQMPNSAKSVRGIINYRNIIYTVIDFRILISQNSILSELAVFKSMLVNREKDHINWLNELENSVLENRPFKLTTDPHQCAFGKWYDNYKTSNIAINKILYQFNEPHKKIHQIACEIEKLKQNNKLEEAQKLIAKTRDNELNTLIFLFSELKQNADLEFKESAILLNLNNKMIALAVDKIISVEDLFPIELDDLQNNSLIKFNENIVTGIGKLKTEEMVLIVSDEKLLN
jgi:chemotaxis signal transduction protein